MKKVIFPIICAVLLPLVFLLKVNPDMEVAGIIIAAIIGLGIGSGINAIVFRKKKVDTKTETETK